MLNSRLLKFTYILCCLNILGSSNLTDQADFGGTALQEAIDKAYKETSKYLLEILINKYKFVEHLKVGWE